MRCLAAGIAVAVLLLASLCACACTWHVPSEAPTIQAGSDSAAVGDTVLVACGTYYEHDLVMKSGICLRSQTGQADCVTIDAEELGRVISCTSVDSTTRIEGMTFANGAVRAAGWIMQHESGEFDMMAVLDLKS